MAKAKAAQIFERDPNDWYVEDEGCTAFLLARERFFGPIYDPCCGGGNIVRTAMDHGLEAYGSDIIRRSYGRYSWFVGIQDFLADGPIPEAPTEIISNPPFFRAVGTETFIRQALAIKSLRKLAVFTDVRFLNGGARATGLYQTHAPSRIWMVSPRPSCPTGTFLAAGGKRGGGTADFCWMIWDLTAPRSGTQILWGTGR